MSTSFTFGVYSQIIPSVVHIKPTSRILPIGFQPKERATIPSSSSFSQQFEPVCHAHFLGDNIHKISSKLTRKSETVSYTRKDMYYKSKAAEHSSAKHKSEINERAGIMGNHMRKE
jgi:hypothetical protein